MRIDKIIENNKKLTKEYNLSKADDVAIAKLSVLTDISETLALFLDVYSNIYGRAITYNGEGEGEQK